MMYEVRGCIVGFIGDDRIPRCANRKEGFLYPIPDSDLLIARSLIEIHSGRQGENVGYHLTAVVG